MRGVFTLAWRNLRAYWRDPMSVFSSMVGPLIMFALFVVFLRKQMAESMGAMVPGSTSADAYGLCDSWMFASITTMATFSTSVGILSAFVEDRVSGRFSDYLVAPLRRWQLALGYVVAVVAVSFTISIAIWGLGQLWTFLQDQPLLTVNQGSRAVLGVFLSCLVFSAFNTVMVTFTATQGAYNGYALVMGTAMGFLSFCYVMPSTLSENLVSVLCALPFAQTAALVRRPSMQPGAGQLFSALPEGESRDQALADLMQAVGADLSVQGHDLTATTMVMILLGMTLFFGIIASWRMGRIIR
jgi:multidrug/hemolysin transport system permease protein